MTDWLLIREYSKTGSNAAFGRIVDRYTKLVYTVCLRELHTNEQVDDAVQIVFLLLSRKIRIFHRDVKLGSWLCTVARNVCRDVRRTEQRRVTRERVAFEISSTREADLHAWERIKDDVYDALYSLDDASREAILLRYIQGMSVLETADALGVTEAAAQKRLNRATEKMRRRIATVGIQVVMAALIALLSRHASAEVPDGLVDKVKEAVASPTKRPPIAPPIILNVLRAMRFAQFRRVALWTAGVAILLLIAGRVTLNVFFSPTGTLPDWVLREELKFDKRHFPNPMVRQSIVPRIVHARVMYLAVGPGTHGGTGKGGIRTERDAIRMERGYINQVARGRSFEEIVRQYSDDPYAKLNSGNAGFIYREMQADFRFVRQALALQKGQVASDPALAVNRVYLVQAISTEEDHPASENADYDAIKRKREWLHQP